MRPLRLLDRGRDQEAAVHLLPLHRVQGRCDEPYVREEILERQFSDLLGRLSFDDEALEWVRDAMHASHADEKREHEGAIERLHTEHKRLQSRLDAMYIDKLDGRVDATFYERMSTSWREEQARCLSEIERHQARSLVMGPGADRLVAPRPEHAQKRRAHLSRGPDHERAHAF